MSPVWKVLLSLALVLPVSAYVAGSLASSAADEPARRDPVVVTPSSGPASTPTTPSSSPSSPSSPSSSPTPTRTASPGDDGTGRDDDDADHLEGVQPELGDVDDDERDDDHSGPGGGGDDHDRDDDRHDRDDDHSGPGGGDDD